MSTASQRAKRKEEVDKAYRLQIQAAALGATKYTALGLSLATVGHYTYPPFRKQTLAFKAFLVSAFTMYGLVVGADTALLSHERQQRISESAIRREARIDLARRGLVGTESEIAKWKDERAQRQSVSASTQSSTQPEHPNNSISDGS